MKISKKLTAFVVILSSVFVVALGMTLMALQNQISSTNKLMHKDVSALTKITNLYANGLQSGQATRNVLLNPEDRKAVENNRKAVAAFSDDLGALSVYFTDKPEQKDLTGQIEEAWNTDNAMKNEIQKLAIEGHHAEAKAMLVEKETAQWRLVKELVQKLENRQKKDLAAEVLTAETKAKNAQWIAITCLVAALLIAAVSINVVNRIISKPLINTGAAAEQIAEGDLTVSLPITSKDEIGSIALSINHISGKLSNIIKQLTESACTVVAASVQLQGNTEHITVNLSEAESQTITLGTASEEMAATSADIARNCHLAVSSSTRASNEARSGVAVVVETIEDMKRIAERVRSSATTVESLGQRSEQIGAIVGTIEDIADQTNLLALNAAIEAARAGEQGRGFAVVADEVRALAERTTRATHEISDMIKMIQSETQSAVTTMVFGVEEVERGMVTTRRSEEALESIFASINEVTEQIDQIATAAEEQTATTQEIAGNIHRVSTVIDTSTSSSRENALAVAQLTGLAEQLLQSVREFKVA